MDRNAHKVTVSLPYAFSLRTGRTVQDALAKSQASTKEGLYEFYANLLDEWRGIIAALAMDPALITRKRVYFNTPQRQTQPLTMSTNRGVLRNSVDGQEMALGGLLAGRGRTKAFIDLLLLENKLIALPHPRVCSSRAWIIMSAMPHHKTAGLESYSSVEVSRPKTRSKASTLLAN